ncbi:MAG: hypothetical protein ABSB91_04660 [Sedimentisphaerales bacterium]|jgi:hypothetical protein
MTCTITKNLEIVPGTRADYQSLSQYHYRQCNLGPYAAIYALKGKFRTAETQHYFDKENIKNVMDTYKETQSGMKTMQVRQNSAGETASAGHLTVGVIVYAMPTAGLQMRSEALPFLAGLDRSTRLSILNKNVRTISRCIIEPRFRSLGLAARLVRETMPLMTVPFVEALAVMGQVNPFFEKAGMTRYDAPPSPACVRLLEALGAVGIEEQDLIDPGLVQQKLDSRPARRDCAKLRLRGNDKSEFIEREITRFLQCYGRRRLMPPGIERTEFVLSKLTDRPVYYLWKNPTIELRI